MNVYAKNRSIKNQSNHRGEKLKREKRVVISGVEKTPFPYSQRDRGGRRSLRVLGNGHGGKAELI